jgi:hypothetical protein
VDHGRVADEQEKPGEQDDERQAHPLGGGLGAGLGLGELPGAHGARLGGQAGADLGALGAGQGDGGGQLGQLGDAELGAELAEGLPGWLRHRRQRDGEVIAHRITRGQHPRPLPPATPPAVLARPAAHKGVVCKKASDLMRYLAANQHVMAENIDCLLEEFDDLKSEPPTVIAFGSSAHWLAAKHLPATGTRGGQ